MVGEKKTVDILENAGIALAAGGAATLITNDPVAALVATGGVTTALGMAFDALKGRRERWWTALLDDPTRSPESVAEQLIEQMKDPKVASAVLRSIRAVMEAVNDAAIPPLAALMKLYSRQQVSDRFFRGAARLLTDCDLDGLQDLRAFTLACAEVQTEGTTLMARVSQGRVVFHQSARDVPRKTPVTVDLDSPRTLSQLERNDLIESDTGWGGRRAGLRASQEEMLHLEMILQTIAPR